ncbi:MAG: hypothetical protein ACFFCD_07775 [Promethearchaeota archaeon]
MTQDGLEKLFLLLSEKKSELIFIGSFVFNSFTLQYIVLRPPASFFIEYRSIWPALLIWLVNFLVFMGMIFLKEKVNLKPVNLWVIAVLTICSRLVYLVYVFISGIIYIDSDIEIFYRVDMGYPQVAVLFFALTVLLSNNNLQAFRWIFPLVQLPFELSIVIYLYKIAKRFKVAYQGSIFASFYAILPLLIIFWYSKYDVIPTSFLLLAVYFLVEERYSHSALFVTLGFLTKWFPMILAPFVIVYLLRKRMFKNALKYVGIICGTSFVIFLPFFILSPEIFFYVFRYHGSRPLTGESFFYIFYYFLEPTHRISPGIVPWVHVEGSIYFTRNKLLLYLLSILSLVFLLFIYRPAALHTTISFGGISIILIAILNRFFSPQYIIWFIIAYIISYLAIPRQEKKFSFFFFLLGVLTFLNYLIWPLTVTYWFVISVLFFLDCWILIIYILFPNVFTHLRKLGYAILRKKHSLNV